MIRRGRGRLQYYVSVLASFHHRVQTGPEAHLASYPIPEGKRPVREADHSPPSSLEVQNAWSYTSIPTCLHGVVLS